MGLLFFEILFYLRKAKESSVKLKGTVHIPNTVISSIARNLRNHCTPKSYYLHLTT